MKAAFAALSLTLFLAGCSACAERKSLNAAHTLASHQKIVSAKETEANAGIGPQFHLRSFLNQRVRDKAGKDVARIEDLAIGVDGRIVSVTLATNGAGAKVTIPFKKLKVTEQSGELYLETDIVHHPEGETIGTAPSSPEIPSP
ncbi:MAG: PRC-barrel domain-containing protein [Rhodomicrobium sp.]